MYYDVFECGNLIYKAGLEGKDGDNVPRTRITGSTTVPKLLLLAASLLILICFFTYTFSPGGNSDAVEGVVWADASLRSGRVLSPSFVYGYAIPAGANLFMLPYVAAFGIGMLSNVLGMLTFSMVIILTAVFFIRSFTTDWIYTLSGAAVLISYYWSRYGEDLIHHILHYQLGMVALLGILGCIFRLWREADRKKRRKVSVLLAFYTFWAGVNGTVTLAFSVLPVLFAIGINTISGQKSTKNGFWMLAVLVGSASTGLAVYGLLMRNVTEGNYIAEMGSYTFRSTDEWAEAIHELIPLWFRLLIVPGIDGVSVKTRQGIWPVLSLLVLFITTITPFVYFYYCSKRREERAGKWLLLSVYLAVWALCLVQFIVFRGPEMRMLYNGLSVNYLLLSVMVIDLLNNCSWHPPCKRFIPIILLCIIGANALCLVKETNWRTDTSLTEKLEERGLTKGYATFWNANINTVKSSGRVQISSIGIENGMVSPWVFQADQEWYDAEKEEGNVFLLLTPGEYNSLNDAYIVMADDEININGFHVLVFGEKGKMKVLDMDRMLFIANYEREEAHSEGTDDENGRRYIHDGGSTSSPWLSIKEDESVQVIMKGEELSGSVVEIMRKTEKPAPTSTWLERNDHEMKLSFSLDADDEVAVTIMNPTGDGFTRDVVIEQFEVKNLTFLGEE